MGWFKKKSRSRKFGKVIKKYEGNLKAHSVEVARAVHGYYDKVFSKGPSIRSVFLGAMVLSMLGTAPEVSKAQSSDDGNSKKIEQVFTANFEVSERQVSKFLDSLSALGGSRAADSMRDSLETIGNVVVEFDMSQFSELEGSSPQSIVEEAYSKDGSGVTTYSRQNMYERVANPFNVFVTNTEGVTQTVLADYVSVLLRQVEIEFLEAIRGPDEQENLHKREALTRATISFIQLLTHNLPDEMRNDLIADFNNFPGISFMKNYLAGNIDKAPEAAAVQARSMRTSRDVRGNN